MSELRIDRLSASAADWPAPGEVAGMLRRVADDRLGRALAEQPLPEGEWCVRRLDVGVSLDPERPLSALETDWADQIVTALRQSLRDGSRDVVRYLRPEQAVDDLFLGLATGRAGREWAWRQVGLLQPGDPDPHTDARAVMLTVAARLPHGPSAALERLVARVGLAPVHRLLGTEGWARLAALVVPKAVAGALRAEPPAPAAPARPVGRRKAAAAEARAMLARVLARGGALPSAIRVAGIRADLPTTRAWAILAIAAADPTLLRRPTGEVAALVDEVGAHLVPGPQRTLAGRRPEPAGTVAGGGATAVLSPTRTATAPRPVDPASPPGDPGGAVGPRGPAEHGRSGMDAIDPVVDSEPPAAHTSWGGLAFLLNTADEAGLPDLLDEPPFRARPAAWVLRRLGHALVGTAEDDPALLVLAGAEADPEQDRASDTEQAAIETCAGRWAAVTADRLRESGFVGAPPDAVLVRRLASREASVLWEPGWVEVCLRLADVDLDVRRAGLDVDPGWVWWIGQVVRFRYE
jgi:hypothetical protein